MTSVPRALVSLCLLLACGTSSPSGDGGNSETGSTQASASTSQGTGTTDASTSTAATSSSEGSASLDGSGGSSFVISPDGGCTSQQCDVWAQDCPRGEKCVPWSEAGDGSFGGCTDARCSEVDPAAHAVGEPCTVEGGPWSGLDDCALGSYCWGVDAETGAGVCVAQCGGSEAEPVCPGDDTCWDLHGTSVTACAASCDPLAPVCGAGTTCTLSSDSDYGPLCLGVDLGMPATADAVCDQRIGCGEGFACLPAEFFTACRGGGCCAPLCDLAEQTCPEPTVCSAVTHAPPGVGACSAN
jgi:hypothetical protein